MIKKITKDIFFEVDAQYPEKLHELHNDSPFFTDRMNFHKVEKLVANLHDKKEYVIMFKSVYGLKPNQLVELIDSMNFFQN